MRSPHTLCLCTGASQCSPGASGIDVRVSGYPGPTPQCRPTQQCTDVCSINSAWWSFPVFKSSWLRCLESSQRGFQTMGGQESHPCWLAAFLTHMTVTGTQCRGCSRLLCGLFYNNSNQNRVLSFVFTLIFPLPSIHLWYTLCSKTVENTQNLFFFFLLKYSQFTVFC